MSSYKQETQLSRPLSFLLALVAGALVANLYYMQPIVGQIAKSLGLAPAKAGLVLSLVQAAYGISVLFLIPLGDILENRKLILSMIGLSLTGILGLAVLDSAQSFFISAFVMGIGASCVQAIIPYVANLVSEEKRGQAVGLIMSGLMIGIMLARPVASFMTEITSWHRVFLFSFFVLLFLALVLYKKLPLLHPSQGNLNYKRLIFSMPAIFLNHEVLRRRSFYQSALFATFCLFWTASPLYLLSETFAFSNGQVAIFALVGVSSATIAPFAGNWADRGWIKLITFASLSLAVISFLMTLAFVPGSVASLISLSVAAIFLDASVSMNLVAGQKAIFSLAPQLRSRLNALYIASIFVGGGMGSALGAWSYERGGWLLTSLLGVLIPSLAFVYFFTEKKTPFHSLVSNK